MTEEPHPRTLRLLRKQDWETIGPWLVAVAEKLAFKKSWRGGGTNHLALGVGAEDIAQEAITRAFEGRRNWDPQKSDLQPWLEQVVASIMHHLVVSKGHVLELAMPEANDGEDLTDLVAHQTSDLEQLAPAQAPDPEDVLLTKEDIEYREGIVLEAAAGDPELEEILDAVIDGCEFKPRYLAEELDVPVEEIYTRVRRLRRRAAKLMIRGREHEEAEANPDQ